MITNSRRNVQPGVFVGVWSWAFIPENILPVVCLVGSDVFPLRVTNFVPVPDRHPPTFANRLSILHKTSPEPGNHLCRLRLCVMIVDVVVRERNVERILARDKICWDEISSVIRVRAVIAPVI